MNRLRMPCVAAAITAAVVALAGCDGSGGASADGVAAVDDAAFAEMQDRGRQAMGVDQYTSTHVFDALPDGGRIELQRDIDDAVGVERIRRHLQAIARAFDEGDFSTPAFVHERGHDPSDVSDEVLARRVQQGDRDALDRLVRRRSSPRLAGSRPTWR